MGHFELRRQVWEILVPVQNNNGDPFAIRWHREWDDKVQKVAGGLTLLEPVKGRWVQNEDQYSEKMIPVRIVATEADMRHIAIFTAEHYDQKAVLFYPVSYDAIMYYK